MTLAQRSNESGNTNTPANDNQDVEAAAVVDEESIADLVRRTERRAMLVLFGMGGWLLLIPAIYAVLTHGI
ncbi:hypothetical protein NKI77_23200 [Mesorhizobium opportunistum]|uniref:Uncharacterized protein n=1 Tax=Mesorhizobium opportunistum TaxID=593909 RepID=A0ABV1YJZ7_9HYPH|nr:hypothetical protein [Mesorhizobium sp.]TIN90805.1 MAG: hypothetical protein E5Y06_30920 [Mesorhizobium sp.]TJU94246.1 MAG: hypothetical protein E5Y08_30895 [Mesorhizobium sp.]TJV44806.1 MAG: hypothetical protein E5Y02_06505 [Mesorhizobium sp.]